ncbi:hypothetical protein TraAM80_09012 [Trypanosoma rangeli]|uniref:Uncharacterized protein n=1 Tax=Trypanosoma rangeli TaxID=5698 RepID=A0A422MXS2_TRYRA|nr:uncharacterized protein TraAM80_09012 [Trypanosoma rangeli]RNE98025.1 hypothetical protein TraAM80_09012 [Trypanosoma rangeli]|eukprot:RNE98025.1 hypothetical protein TraAM80_09012 [Trypanosoma rangeli]
MFLHAAQAPRGGFPGCPAQKEDLRIRASIERIDQLLSRGRELLHGNDGRPRDATSPVKVETRKPTAPRVGSAVLRRSPASGQDNGIAAIQRRWGDGVSRRRAVEVACLDKHSPGSLKASDAAHLATKHGQTLKKMHGAAPAAADAGNNELKGVSLTEFRDRIGRELVEYRNHGLLRRRTTDGTVAPEQRVGHVGRRCWPPR